MSIAYVAFGSNLGESLVIIEKAFSEIQKNGVEITKKSKIYETKPYGYKEQPDFVNGAIEIHTELSCRELLSKLLAIELELGRVREIHWGPRVIDLDIIFFNDEIHKEKDLIVPHPDMQNRDFVLKPLNDLCPGYVHPVLGITVEKILCNLNNQ